MAEELAFSKSGVKCSITSNSSTSRNAAMVMQPAFLRQSSNGSISTGNRASTKDGAIQRGRSVIGSKQIQSSFELCSGLLTIKAKNTIYSANEIH